jgi:predicted ATPase
MAMLTELWAHAQDGSGQVVGIAGEPGVGKSRLLAEFIRACQPTSVRLLETWSTAYTQTMPYRPFIDLLRGYFSIEERDDGPMIREQVVQQLVYLNLPRSLILSPLLTLLEGPLDDPTWQAIDSPRNAASAS